MNVVEADDVMGDIGRCLGEIDVVALPDPRHLQSQEEELRRARGFFLAAVIRDGRGDPAKLRRQGAGLSDRR